MPLTKQERIERLQEEVKAIIAEVFGDKTDFSEVTLSEIEQAVARAGQEFEQTLTQEMVSQASEGARVEGPVCSGCGQEMEQHGTRRKRVVSETGEVLVERKYYYCRKCQRGCFPPG
jgi:DNA repair exonuclease SbcCD ATPase subunit